MNKKELIKKISQQITAENTMFKEGVRLIYAGGVYRVIQIGNKKPYAAITAFRKEYSLEENRKRNEALLKEIKSLGLYAYKMIGFYKECPKGKPECSDEEKVPVEEESFFVPYREDLDLDSFVEKMVNLGHKFNQDSVLVGLSKNYSYKKDFVKVNNYEVPVGKHYYLNLNGIAAEIGTKITVEKLTEYGSIAIDPKKKDRKIEWLVTGVAHPVNVMSRMSYKTQHLTWVEGLDEEKMNYIILKDLF